MQTRWNPSLTDEEPIYIYEPVCQFTTSKLFNSDVTAYKYVGRRLRRLGRLIVCVCLYTGNVLQHYADNPFIECFCDA